MWTNRTCDKRCNAHIVCIRYTTRKLLPCFYSPWNKRRKRLPQTFKKKIVFQNQSSTYFQTFVGNKRHTQKIISAVLPWFLWSPVVMPMRRKWQSLLIRALSALQGPFSSCTIHKTCTTAALFKMVTHIYNPPSSYLIWIADNSVDLPNSIFLIR